MFPLGTKIISIIKERTVEQSGPPNYCIIVGQTFGRNLIWLDFSSYWKQLS
jgi:hypothetical protein